MVDANQEIEGVKAGLTSEETTTILGEARASRQAKPKGITPWRATDHPDWTTPGVKKL